jgi:hypothetical protein
MQNGISWEEILSWSLVGKVSDYDGNEDVAAQIPVWVAAMATRSAQNIWIGCSDLEPRLDFNQKLTIEIPKTGKYINKF